MQKSDCLTIEKSVNGRLYCVWVWSKDREILRQYYVDWYRLHYFYLPKLKRVADEDVRVTSTEIQLQYYRR